MKTLIRLLIFLCFALPTSAATVFVSQSGGSVSCGADGTQSTSSVSTFNSSQVAGNTYKLCGTITSQLAPNTSGSAGNIITLQWESNASVQVCNTTGALNLSGLSYYLLDSRTMKLDSNRMPEQWDESWNADPSLSELGIMATGGSSFTNTEIQEWHDWPSLPICKLLRWTDGLSSTAVSDSGRSKPTTMQPFAEFEQSLQYRDGIILLRLWRQVI